MSLGEREREATYEFDDLATDDVFHQIHRLRRGILNLAEDEHLEPRVRQRH
jgi:hypothetical protein